MIEEKRGRVGAHIDASKLGSSPAPLECSEFLALPGHLSDGRQLDEERADVVRRGGHRVILSGIGGDEFLGGIPNPSAQLADLIVRFKPFALAQQLMAWSLVKRRPWTRLLGQTLLDLLPASLGQYFAMRARVEPWISKTFATRTSLAVRLLDVDEHFGLWLPSRRSCIAGVLLMANKLAKVRPPVAAPEECRFPFLDQNLIEFILSIPASQLLRPGERRSLMRRSLVGIVPQEILARRTKQFGARTPVTAMGKNAERLRAIFDESLSSQLGYVNDRCFLARLKAAQNGQEIHIVRMLRTISLEFWLRDLASRGLIGVSSSSPKLRSRESVRVGT
jgi:asparagine synthase (glutamine-hydrolysing)